MVRVRFHPGNTFLKSRSRQNRTNLTCFEIVRAQPKTYARTDFVASSGVWQTIPAVLGQEGLSRIQMNVA